MSRVSFRYIKHNRCLFCRWWFLPERVMWSWLFKCPWIDRNEFSRENMQTAGSKFSAHSQMSKTKFQITCSVCFIEMPIRGSIWGLDSQCVCRILWLGCQLSWKRTAKNVPGLWHRDVDVLSLVRACFNNVPTLYQWCPFRAFSDYFPMCRFKCCVGLRLSIVMCHNSLHLEDVLDHVGVMS